MKPLIIDPRNPEFYNPVINSNFDFHQRLVGNSITRTNLATPVGYDADKTVGGVSGGGAARSITLQRSTNVPVTKIPAIYSRQLTNNTAIASFAATEELYAYGHPIEGTMWKPFAGQNVTIGFHFFSSVGGVIPVAFQRAAYQRSYVATVNSIANQWQYFVVHLPADTSGPAFSYGNSDIYRISIAGLAGTNRQAGSLNTWLTADVWTHASATNYAAFVGSVIRIAQVQVRLGFRNADEMKNGYVPHSLSYLGEQQACMRYYEKSYDDDVVPGTSSANGYTGIVIAQQETANEYRLSSAFRVRKRAIPGITIWNPSTGTQGQLDNGATAQVIAIGQNGFTAGKGPATVNSNGTVYHWTADADL